MSNQDDSYSEFTTYYRIIHREALCAMVLILDKSWNVVNKITTRIRAAALHLTLLKTLIGTVEADYKDLYLHTEG